MTKTTFPGFFVLLLLFDTKLFAQDVAPYNPKHHSEYLNNYIRSWDVMAPVTDPNTVAGKPLREVKQTTSYFDGLGRPLQTVTKQGSLVTGSSAKDIIAPIQYDEFGRERRAYLPYASPQNNGVFRISSFDEQKVFYDNSLSGQGETFYYGQTKFEVSPLGRVQENFAPGNSWSGTSSQAAEANRKSVKTKYYSNTTIDQVRIWGVTEGALGTYGVYTTPAGTAGFYAADQLTKTISLDENNKQTIEFKDKEGKLILKKVQLAANPDNGSGSGYTGWLCTYYIYDDWDNLRCVVQPKGVELVIGLSWVLTNATILAEQCFRYAYDERNRMIMKKVPGAGDVYMVYDARDRLIMTQDGKQRTINQWLATFYDELGRPIQTGTLLNTYFGATAKTFVQHLTSAKIVSNGTYPFNPATPPTATHWDLLTKTGYDTYANFPSGAGLTAALNTTYTTSPYITGSFNIAPDYAQNPIMSQQTMGMATWTQTKILDYAPVTYLYSVNIYDEKGRLIQVKSKNITGGEDIVTTQYSWAGQPLISIQKTEKRGHLCKQQSLLRK